MDKAAIKLHKINIFPKVPPLYTHLPSTFLPVFSGTMLPNGLPVSCLPPPDSIPTIVGATTRRPHASPKIMLLSSLPYLTFVCFGQRSPVCRGDHRSPARLGCHLHMPRPKKRAVNDRPNKSYSRKGGMPTRGIPPFLELLMGFGSRLRARSSAALTVPRTVIHYRSPPNPISKKLSHPQGMREFSGAANGIRTHDLVITNDVLYRLSYSSVSNA